MQAPIDVFLHAIKGKYKAKILISLGEGTLRYSQLKRKFTTASERIIIKQLKELEQEGLIEKKVSGVKPPLKVEYSMSNYGKTMCPIIKQMWSWGEMHQSHS